VPRRPWCKLREPTNLFGPTGRNPGHRVGRRAPKPLSSALMTVQTLQEQASERLGPPKEDVGTKRRIECSRGSASKQISEFNNRTRRRLKRRGGGTRIQPSPGTDPSVACSGRERGARPQPRARGGLRTVAGSFGGG